MMTYEAVALENKEHIGTIRFNRPEQMNAVNTHLTAELLDALLRLDRDDEVRVVIITGTGNAFCAGLDIAEAIGRIEENRPILSSPSHMVPAQMSVPWIPLIIRQMKKPVIAMINGAAVGAGFSIALACDIRIASDQAKMGAPFVRVGLTPEFGSTYTLPRLVGMGKACELIFCGDILDAGQCKVIGLVNEVVPAAELEQFTYRMAKKMAQSPSLPLQLAKRALYQGMDADFSSQLQFEALALGTCARTEDHLEALKAFLEKRKPVFKDV
jgi:2-(1,2-epoxy-1,2-dihydrophenyl)acetyl-CoA isomerase